MGENEVGFHVGKAGSGSGQISQTNKQSETAQEQTLKSHGCVCTSPHLEFSTTTTKHLTTYPDHFGHYHFKGMNGGHPYCEFVLFLSDFVYVSVKLFSSNRYRYRL